MDLDLMVSELVRDEGLRLFPYKDTVGKTTIGIGRNLDDVGISDEEARHLLANDLIRTMGDLDRHLSWWRDLDEDRQRVLANICFNVGIGSLLGFKVTLARVQAGDYAGAANSLKASKWAFQVGPRADRLITRMRGTP